MDKFFLKLIAVVSLGMFAFSANVNAAVVTTYTGANFDPLLTDPPFTTFDRVTGFAVFDLIGDSVAREVTLSVTTNGGPGFSITQSNVGGFIWVGDTPDEWNIIFAENVFAGSIEEEFFVNDSDGDVVTIDFNGPSEAIALAPFGAPGVWSSATAVPEPSSLAALALGSIGLGVARLRRKKPCHKQK